MGFFDLLFGGTQSFNKVVRSETRDKIASDWALINVLLSQKGPSQLKQALITADRCLDNALRDIAEGNTFGERLKNSQDKFDRDTYNKLWEAHKLRNGLVHESGFDAPHFVIKEAVTNLQKGLMALGVRV